MHDYDDELRRDAIREAKVDAWWDRWGCDTCDFKGRVLCSCVYVDNGFDGCDRCEGTSYIECDECEGKGHFFRRGRPRLPSDVD